MIDVPQIVYADEQPTAVIHIVVSRNDIEQVMSPAIAEVLSVLAAQGIAPAGPCFTYHLRRPAEIFDFDVGFPVPTPLAPAGRVKPGKLPAARVARTVYHGGYGGLGPAWGEFIAWVEKEGLKPRGSLWERYVAGPESGSDPEKWRTELNLPLD